MTRKKVSASTRQPVDYGSPHLAKRFTIVPKLTASNGYHGKVVDDTEIDKLLLHDDISALEHSLLVALLQRLRKATFIGLKSPDFNGVAHSDPSIMADRKANAVVSVVGLMKRLDQKLGRAQRASLINLVLLDVPWPGTLDALHGCIFALQDLFGSGQGKLKGEKTGKDRFPVWMHANS